MGNLLGAVAELEQRLDQHVQYIHDQALASHPHGTPAWDQCLGYYRLTPPPRENRINRATELGQTRGALPEEVRSVFYVVTMLIQSGLDRMPGLGANVLHGGDERANSKAHFIKARLVTLVQTEGGRYEQQVRPPTGGGGGSLGGIFANVKRTSQLDFWTKMKEFEPGNVLLSCVCCGAPQQVAANFTCQFCDQYIFGQDIKYDD